MPLSARHRLPLAASLLVVAALVVVASGPTRHARGDDDARSQTAQAIAVTGGAAPGYVDDGLCAGCHQDLYAGYQAVGMARAFGPPDAVETIEDFDAPPFFHERSQRYYTIRRTQDGGGLRFRRFQRDDAGQEINVVEQDIAWVMGSGNRSRVYLYRTAAGELYQLPLAWYTQGAHWAMAPGYDQAHHQGLDRRVQRECMFCHNAYPDDDTSDAYLEAQTFPAELPHGIGCQRCHGPGAAHVQQGYADVVDFDALAASIVNPADLDAERRRDVCYQCHFQPSVALMGIRRFGRGVYSYRPGEPLADYLAHVEVTVEDEAPGERFEINHHPYRLEQSTCFVESAGALSCLTCHDPHVKVTADERKVHYRDACSTCHEVDTCTLESMSAAQRVAADVPTDVAVDDCVACHMPQRRTQDVVHAVMTDHRITRLPAPAADRLAPREETTPIIVDAQLIDPPGDMSPALREIYRAVSVLRAGGGDGVGPWIAKHLDQLTADDRALEARLDLGRALLREQRFDDAHAAFRALLGERPGDAILLSLMTLSSIGRGDNAGALATAREAVRRHPTRADLSFNLGRLLLTYEGAEAALPFLQQAVGLRDTMASGWYRLGEAYARLGETAGADQAFRRTLAIEPGRTDAYLAYARLKLKAGDRDEALRYLRHGARFARDHQKVAEALKQIEAMPTPTGAGRR